MFKTDDEVRTARYQVSLDAETVATARSIGEGNLSLGLRRLAKGAKISHSNTSLPITRPGPRLAIGSGVKSIIPQEEQWFDPSKKK